MSKIIAAIDLGLPEVENAKGADHLASIASDQEKAERLIASLVASKGGRFIGLLDSKFMTEMNIEAGPILKEIKRRLNQEIGIRATIGVGEEAQEATKALKHALKECPGTIKIFEPEMDMQGPSEPVVAVSEDTVVNKTEKQYKDKIPGGLADKKKPSDFDQDSLKAGTKVEMEHTDDPELAQQIAMDHLVEDPNYYKKLKTIEKSEDLAKSIDAASRQQILETMASIKQNAQLFDELKQSQPDVYAGIVSVVQSLTEMLKQAKIDDAEQTQKLVDVINKQIGKKSEQRDKKEGKAIDKELLAERQRISDAHSNKMAEISKRSSIMRRLERQRAREFAAKTGHHDPEFLAKLARAFKGS